MCFLILSATITRPSASHTPVRQSRARPPITRLSVSHAPVRQPRARPPITRPPANHAPVRQSRARPPAMRPSANHAHVRQSRARPPVTRPSASHAPVRQSLARPPVTRPSASHASVRQLRARPPITRPSASHAPARQSRARPPVTLPSASHAPVRLTRARPPVTRPSAGRAPVRQLQARPLVTRPSASHVSARLARARPPLTRPPASHAPIRQSRARPPVARPSASYTPVRRSRARPPVTRPSASHAPVASHASVRQSRLRSSAGWREDAARELQEQASDFDPRKDYATLRDGVVNNRVADRLQQRLLRATPAAGHTNTNRGTPLLERGLRARSWRISGHLNRTCPARCAGRRTRVIAAVVAYRRSFPCHNPCLDLEDAWGKAQLKYVLSEWCPEPQADRQLLQTVVVLSAVGAISCRPEVLEAFGADLAYGGPLDAPNATARSWVRVGRTFFRGGQPHGGLKYEYVPASLGSFLREHVEHLTNIWSRWSSALDDKSRRVSALASLGEVGKSAKVWQGGDYYIQRAIEVVLLALIEGSPKDLDACLHRWPLSSGTRCGLTLISPIVSSLLSESSQPQSQHVKSDQCYRGKPYRQGFCKSTKHRTSVGHSSVGRSSGSPVDNQRFGSDCSTAAPAPSQLSQVRPSTSARGRGHRLPSTKCRFWPAVETVA
ncbi:hypothetical protein N9L68_01305 [bacterium]|nr:hypothetical protein [bacterium]